MNFEDYENKLPYKSRNENKEAYLAYHQETVRIEDQFREDLFKELGIENNPKREKLYSKAWEMGHYAGFHEVYNYALDLVDLIE